ncbi:MAG: hypothetical protein OEW58_00590 [Gammaproteobacteria bacterium]|nr:hypothetical protein [Gammaproteobacteria bacterium]
MYDETKDILIPIASILVSVVVAYCTAIYAFRRESSHGRLRLLELVRRYFLNVLNASDQGTNQIKQDATSKKMYVEELKAILQELQNLVAHPYFSVLIEKYPLLSMVLVQSRREIVEHEIQKSFALNVGTMTQFWRLHQILSKDLSKIMKSELDKTIILLATAHKLGGHRVKYCLTTP